MKKLLTQISHYIKIILVLLFIIIEDLTWNKIGEPVYRRIKALQIMQKFRTWVLNVKHRYALLAIFLSVFLLMEITSTLGLILVGTGAIYTGVLLYSAKIFLTVPAVVIFNTGKKTLLTFWIIRFVFSLIIHMKRSRVFRLAKTQFRNIKSSITKFKKYYFPDTVKSTFTRSFKILYRYLKR